MKRFHREIDCALAPLTLGIVILAHAPQGTAQAATCCTNSLCAVHTATSGSGPGGQPQQPAGLNGGNTVLASCPNLNSHLLDLQLYSSALSTSCSDTVSARVILPPDYTPTSTRTWPVLYLLTGYNQTYESWTCDTFLTNYLAGAEAIVVMPDGTRAYNPADASDNLLSHSPGKPGFYSDWMTPSDDGSPEGWETFIIDQLIPFMEQNYHASQVRAIAGLSMGGMGAMTLAARHPGMFVAAASYSGYLHTSGVVGVAAENVALITALQNTNAIWGYAPGTPGAQLFGTQWPEHDPTSLASGLLGIPLFVSGGNGAVGSFQSGANGTAAQALEAGAGGGTGAVSNGMSYDFVQALIAANGGVTPPNLTLDFYGNGTHSWAYWDAEVCRSMPGLMCAMGVPYAGPECPEPNNVAAPPLPAACR